MTPHYIKIKRHITKATRFYLYLFLIIVTSSCFNSKPLKEYCYKGFSISNGWQSNQEIEFILEIDTLSTSKIFMCAVIKNNQVINSIDKIPINIKFISPSGLERAYSIDLPLSFRRENSSKIFKISNGAIEAEWPLISNIKNRESGEYKVIIKQASNNIDIYKSIIGVGLKASTSKIKE